MGFWEKLKGKRQGRPDADYDVESENLAIPEVHLHGHHGHKEEAEAAHHGESISYDNVAIPEIHIRKKN